MYKTSTWFYVQRGRRYRKMAFFKNCQQFCGGDWSVGWLLGCMQGRYSDLANVSLSD